MAPCDFVYQPMCIFLIICVDHCPTLAFTAVSPAMHLQESRNHSVLLCFTSPQGSCQLNLANSRIPITTDGSPAELFLAHTVSQWMLQPSFLTKSFVWVNQKHRIKSISEGEKVGLTRKSMERKEEKKQGTSFCFQLRFSLVHFAPGSSSDARELYTARNIYCCFCWSRPSPFRLSPEQLPSKEVRVSGTW